ncbi:GTPase activating protein [Scheffersomyces xylosifermentans]|uniref:GTPase activating protein n=1 Tax=Scheffersomyces xylosifermentans TaxID=1304137 RepID=UPI00315D7466
MDQLSQISFPYFESATSSVSLHRLILTNETDSTRYVLTLDDKKHVTSVNKILTQNQQVVPELVNFIQNPSINDKTTTPLLIRFSPEFHKLKLNVVITPTENFLSKSLVIVKSVSDNDNIEELKHVLYESYHSEIEISKIDYSNLPVDPSIPEPQRLIINDVFDKKRINDDKLNVSLWELDTTTNEYSHLLKFSIWVDKYSKPLPPSPVIHTKEPHKHEENLRVKHFKFIDFKREFNFNIEDGPDFRKALTRYENSLPLYRRAVSNLSDELRALDLALKKLTSIKLKLVEIFNSTEFQFNSLITQFGFPKEFEKSLRSLFDPFEKNLRFFLKDVCDQKLLQKIALNLSVNTLADGSASSSNQSSNHHNELLQHRKQFESNSKEYYSWLNKYLSNEKDRPESKLLAKRKSFELSKFDYLNHLNTITNNQYSNQLAERFFKFINLPFDERNPKLLDYEKFKDVKLSQSLIGENYQIYINVLLRFNSEKYQFRQMIEACQSNEELTNIIKYNKLNHNAAPNGTPMSPSSGSESSVTNNIDEFIINKDNLDLVFSSSQPSGDDIVPLSPPINADQNSEMAGILYTLGGQGKQGWHKEWVVLNNGQLKEYSDWRSGKSPINKPIEIVLSSVKPITYDKRQNCFEIVTSSRTKHVFQAINEDERNKWIKALYNAGQLVNTSRLEGKNNSTTMKKDLSNLITDLSEKPVIPGQSMDRSISPISITSSKPLPAEEKDYLNLVRSIPNSNNHICLDCGSLESVEWISINCLACFCIKCASCHRNIGSHITKIRSLKLDKFENESEQLLKYINNCQVNLFLEENLHPREKIGPSATDEARLEFIRKKYLIKKYKSIIPDINNQLIKSIQQINLPDVLRNIICGGDINIRIQINIPNKQEYQVISLFEYSLRKFIEIKDDDLILSSSKKLFIISELLILNGCKIDDIKDLRKDIGLTQEAIEYWKIRSLKLSGGVLIP